MATLTKGESRGLVEREEVWPPPKNIYNKIAQIRLGTWNYFCAVTGEEFTDVLVASEVTTVVVKVDIV